MIDTNIKGLAYVTRHVLPLMVEREKGHIINIGSTAGHDVYPAGNVYAATKFAVKALSQSTRYDVLDKGIKVTSVDPGMKLLVTFTPQAGVGPTRTRARLITIAHPPTPPPV